LSTPLVTDAYFQRPPQLWRAYWASSQSCQTLDSLQARLEGIAFEKGAAMSGKSFIQKLVGGVWRIVRPLAVIAGSISALIGLAITVETVVIDPSHWWLREEILKVVPSISLFHPPKICELMVDGSHFAELERQKLVARLNPVRQVEIVKRNIRLFDAAGAARSPLEEANSKEALTNLLLAAVALSNVPQLEGIPDSLQTLGQVQTRLRCVIQPIAQKKRVMVP
jgi:hypothetical protein